MNNCIKRVICLTLLPVLIIGLFAGCRKSPALEKVIYVNPPEKKEISSNPQPQKKEEEKPQQDTAKNITAENKASQQSIPQAEPQQITNLEGTGETEYEADLTGLGDDLPQLVTSGGIAVTVPESMDMVTTVSEATQNPHWKSSINYDSSQYSGNRENGFFEGQGTYIWDDGEKYLGEWKNGFFDGQGLYHWANGDQYEGQWKIEVFDGQGTYTWASGSYYTGQWKAGVKEGQGTYTWANGDQYIGEWKAGVKEGQGVYTWANGSSYEGEWKYGIKEGQGTYRGADGTVYQGLWANDQFVGNQ